MANNRLYIRCKQCGESFCIGKHSQGVLYITNPQKFGDYLNAFYAKHNYCGEWHYSLELCEEFPGEITDNNIDCYGKVIWYKYNYGCIKD